MRKFTLTFLIFSSLTFAGYPKKEKVKYRTYFGKCPSKVVGNLTLKVIKEFEKSRSLRDVKNKIINEKLDQKHFLSSYSLKFDPLENFLKLSFDCPEPLMKVQIYKKNGLEYYSAILVDNGKLFDPTYEYILEQERKLKITLPSLALPVGEIDNDMKERIAFMMKNIPVDFRKKISEVILDDKQKLTIIISDLKKATSAFLGADAWLEKTKKLIKVFSYLEKKKRHPTIINLNNAKKVVVKFSDRI